MTPTDAQLRALLLRRAPAAELDLLESAILVEDDVAERLEAQQFDLLDDYATDSLPAEDRADVERHLLCALGNLESLRISRALIAAKESRSGLLRQLPKLAVPALPSAVKNRRYAVTGALLAAGLIAVVVIPQWKPVSRPLPVSPGTVAAVSVTEASPTIAAPSDPPVVILRAEVQRGAAVPTLRWQAGSATLRLQAEVPDRAPRTFYTVDIDDAAGNRLFDQTALPVHAAGRYHFVELQLPVGALGPGARTISLRAADAVVGAPDVFTWHVVGMPE